MADLEVTDIKLSIPIDTNHLEEIKDFLINNLTSEQLIDMGKDIVEESKIREMKELRIKRFKNEMQKKRMLMKKQLKEEEDEERSKIKKKMRKEIEDDEFDLPVHKSKKKN